jgi:hypothetical protein
VLPPRAEAMRFLAYYRAVSNPMSVLDEMAAGTATKEGVEVLRRAYPHMYRAVLSQLMQELANPDAPPVPYRQRVEIGLRFGLGTDASLTPAFLATIQGAHSQAGMSQPENPNTTAAPKLAQSAASDSDRLVARRAM